MGRVSGYVPSIADHVCLYEYVQHDTDEGKAFMSLNILDEPSQECLAIRVKRKLNSIEVIDTLTIACQCIAQQYHAR
jgi:hypothetical protein